MLINLYKTLRGRFRLSFVLFPFLPGALMVSGCVTFGGSNVVAVLPGAPMITSGPTFIAAKDSPGRDRNGDGVKDTYGPTEMIKLMVGVSKQACGDGSLALKFQTGSGRAVTRKARYCGCNAEYVFFCYPVQRGDRDGDGVGIPANAVSLTTYDGVVVDPRHRAFASHPGHRVDGNLPDIYPPRIESTPGIDWKPRKGEVLRLGDVIRMEATFSEKVVVDTTGGRPTLALKIGGKLRHAPYFKQEDDGYEHRLIFVYNIKSGDRDDDGVIDFPEAHLRVPEGSSIRDLAGNPAELSWGIISSVFPFPRVGAN